MSPKLALGPLGKNPVNLLAVNQEGIRNRVQDIWSSLIRVVIDLHWDAASVPI